MPHQRIHRRRSKFGRQFSAGKKVRGLKVIEYAPNQWSFGGEVWQGFNKEQMKDIIKSKYGYYEPLITFVKFRRGN